MCGVFTKDLAINLIDLEENWFFLKILAQYLTLS